MSTWAAFERGIGREGQENGERQVDRARLGRVQDATNHVGQWRGVIKLKQRPRQRHADQKFAGEPNGLTRPSLGFGDKIAVILLKLGGGFVRAPCVCLTGRRAVRHLLGIVVVLSISHGVPPGSLSKQGESLGPSASAGLGGE